MYTQNKNKLNYGQKMPYSITEMVRYIKNKIIPRTLTADERKVITNILDDLERAIKEYKS